jgi:hypothetical protein
MHMVMASQLTQLAQENTNIIVSVLLAILSSSLEWRHAIMLTLFSGELWF